MSHGDAHALGLHTALLCGPHGICGVLVFLGCHNQTQQTGYGKQQKYISLTVLEPESKIKVSVGLDSSETSLACRQLSSPCVFLFFLRM